MLRADTMACALSLTHQQASCWSAQLVWLESMELELQQAQRDTGRSINGSCLELLEPVWKAFTLTVSC